MNQTNATTTQSAIPPPAITKAARKRKLPQHAPNNVDWCDTPWAKWSQYQNEWSYSTPILEVQIRLKDELFSAAADIASAYMKQDNHLIGDALDAMQSHYNYLEDYGLLSKQECGSLFEQKLQQIYNDPLGQMIFFQSSYQQWKNPAFVVAFYVAMGQKLLPPSRIVHEACMEFTSTPFSYPIDTDSDDADT